MYKIPANTVFLGKKLVFMPECHSTNTVALELCHEKPPPPEGTVIITANQTAGRGQRGNTWIVEDGKNFTLSAIFYPRFLAIKSQFYLNIVTSLGVRDYLVRLGCDHIRVKWPNDVMIGTKKVCGILVENIVSGNSLDRSIAGIGLNVNQFFPTPSAATSVAQSLGRSMQLSEELDPLLSALEVRYQQLRNNHLTTLRNAYHEALYWRHEQHRFNSNGIEFEGVIDGINDLGQLVVSTTSGAKTFNVREVSYLH